MMSLLLACVGADDTRTPKTEDPAAEGGSVRSETFTATTDSDGYVEIPVTVEEGDVLQVVLGKGRGLVAFEYILDPDGNTVLDWEDWWDSTRSLTDCILPAHYAVAANWPVRAEDGPLSAGTWTFVGTTLDGQYNYQGDQDVEIEVLARPEPDPATGTLRAIIAYAEGVDDDPDVVAATEEAVAYWGELYASIGVTLEPTYSKVPVDPELPAAYAGQDEIEALLDGSDVRTVLLVVGESVDGDETLYGEAAAIPGPYAPTPITVVEVGWLANAGANAVFSDDEVLLFGETMAHEVGHFLGLYHPVEDGGYDAWEWWDALDDTEECVDWRSCENALGANLMFPYPLCYSRTCDRQDQITGDQAGVLNRYVGVE